MCEGYGNCVCMCVTALAATYLIYESQVRYYIVPYGVSNMYCVDFAENRFILQYNSIHNTCG